MYAYVCVCMCLYVYVCVCMRMYAYECVCMCMYVYEAGAADSDDGILFVKSSNRQKIGCDKYSSGVRHRGDFIRLLAER